MASECNIEVIVHGLVTNCRHVLSSGADGDAMRDSLQTVSALLPGTCDVSPPAGLSLASLPAAQSEFLRVHHSAWLRFLVQRYSVDWVSTLGRGTLASAYDPFFLRGADHEALCVLGQAIIQLSTFQAAKCADLLEQILQKSLQALLVAQCIEGRLEKTHPVYQQMLVLLASLPERVTGKLHLESSALFYPDAYVALLARNLLAALAHLHQRLVNSQDCSLEFLSHLLGKLCLGGYANRIWGHLLPVLVNHTREDFVWSRLTEKLLSGIPDRALESSVLPLLQKCPSGHILSKFLGSSVLTRQKLKFLFTQKFLFVRHFPEDHLLQTLLGYLASSPSTRSLLLQVLQQLLSVWGDKSSLKHTSHEQHVYLTRAILVSLAFLSPQDRATVREDCMKSLMTGMQTHLDNSSPSVRHQGMIVAEAITDIPDIKAQEHKLKFEYEEDDETKRLKSLLSPPSDKTVEELSSKLEAAAVLTVDTSCADKAAETKPCEDAQHDSELDSDDDLEPYDLSNDVKVNTVKRPVYLRDCMKGLLNSEDPNQVEVCLQNAERLVRSHATSAKEVAVEFTKILLHLENQTCVSDFLHCRHHTMVALLCVHPTKVAEYLTLEFYDKNYNIRQRMDILHGLASAAQELSEPKKTKTTTTNLPLVSIISEDSVEQEDWRAIVQRRIESKTRRFAKGQTLPEPVKTINQFAPVAGHFVFPLLGHFDRKELTFDLLGNDHILLTQLVYTLGSLMYSALHAPIATQIGVSILEFLWVVRYHPQQMVRQAVLYATSMVLLAVPSHSLMSDLSSQVPELREWLQDVVEKDVDEECQKRGLQALVLLQNSLKKEFEAGTPL